MPRILLIEDEPGIADTVVYALETEGMTVDWQTTGGAALASLARGDHDLVVLDVGLPDGNGFDLFRRLRAQRDLPVVFLTARSDEVDRVVGLEMGADDYVVKPFSPRELAARIRAVLRRGPRTATTGTASPGPFAVDRERRCIRYHDHALGLTPYEYHILRLMVERPGRICSRGQLMEAAWGEPDVALERTVDSHIKAIRAKLREIDPAANPIVTHRGHGYALEWESTVS